MSEIIVEEVQNLQERVAELLENKDIKSLKSLLQGIDDNLMILQIIQELSRSETAIVFRLLSKEQALYIFEELDTPVQRELLESFTDSYACELVEELSPDDRVHLFDELPAKVAKRLIGLLSPEERKVTYMLMGYEPETAGRIMTPYFISLKKEMTAGQALEKIRKQARDEDTETIYTLYVTDQAKKLEGSMSLRKLLIAEPHEKIGDIMHEVLVKVSTDTDQEEVANALKDYDLLSIPVVDKEDRIVGIVTIDDAMDIMEHEATEDMYTAAGLADITGKETNRSEVLTRGSLWANWKVRLPFLFITMLAGIGAAFIMDGFEEILSTVVAVMFFIPVVMDMGGSVGTQSTTVFARGVVLGHITPKRFFKQLGRETFIGFTIGAIFGVIMGFVAMFWQQAHLGWHHGAMLGISVGLALCITVTIASMLGFFIPWLLMKMKMDQAAGSAPLITSVKDIVGLLVYFGLASLFMSGLLY
ncbi:MAG: magnesium transporter [Firmicutes bacterium]|nr:magnesium transporter [Bacillota bacterium]